ncbi:hypothetical protein [Armatimonas sp.]|uniref:hypothetical protein n=1 Tax=Armatimonas sp. TaxID=1872638 RepID=UPI0037533D34
MDGGLVAVFIILVIFIGIISIIGVTSWHKQELEKIRARKQGEGSTVQMSDELRAELRALKEQVLALRDTTTKFDLSFDAILDGVEERLKRVEERQLSQSYQTTDDAQKLTAGR